MGYRADSGKNDPMRTAAKVDTTQRSIVRALREAGVHVSLTPVGRGFPDAILSYRRFVCLGEFKSGSRGLNELQRKFRDEFQGPIIVTNNPEEAVSKFFTEYACSVLGKSLGP